MSYSTASHTTFYHRYHVVWATKYRYKVLQGPMRERIREIIRQTCAEMGVHIIKGVLARDHVLQYLELHSKRDAAGVRWSVCRPPLTASQCAKVVVLNATQKGGRRDEGYDRRATMNSWNLQLACGLLVR